MMGRTALVSGGTRGIGRAVALRLAHDGYDIGFCYQSSHEVARDLEKALCELGVKVYAHQADVTDAEAVRAFVAGTVEALGPIDVVVTSAGITRDKPLVLMDDEDWQQVLDVNLDGVYHVCRAAIFEMMKRRRGSIINVSSVAGVHGNATQTNYSASKAGIIGFSKALAKEVGRYGIRANVVAPGFIETDMTSGLSDQVKKRAIDAIPLRRFGGADEVAELIAFLASDRAAYITGAVVQVDGGITI